jgi:hypothetical protein
MNFFAQIALVLFLILSQAAAPSTLQAQDLDFLPYVSTPADLRRKHPQPLLFDSVASTLVSERRAAAGLDFLLSAKILHAIVNNGEQLEKISLYLALLETILNSTRFKSEKDRLNFFQRRYSIHTKRPPEELAVLLTKAGYIGFHIQLSKTHLGTHALDGALPLYPEYATRDFDMLSGNSSYDDKIIRRAAELAAAGRGRYEVRHSFDSAEPLFRSFLSNYASLSPSNQFSIVAATTGANFTPGLFPRSQISNIFQFVRNEMKKLDARIEDPKTSDPEKAILKDRIATLADKLLVSSDVAADLVSTPVLRDRDAKDAPSSLQDQKPEEADDWKKFAEMYNKNAKLFYQTLGEVVALAGIDDPSIQKSIKDMQTMTNLAIAAGTQNYLALVASGVQIAGEIFGTGSNGSEGGTAAMVQQMVAIRRDIANLKQVMLQRFDRIERKLDQIDRNLNRQFDFLVSHFRLVEDKLDDIKYLAVAASEEEYRYRLNNLSSVIDSYNQDFWRGVVTRSTPTQSFKNMSEAINNFMASYLSISAGATGISHPRYVGSYACFDRAWRDLTGAKVTDEAIKGLVVAFFKSLRAPDFGQNAACVNRLYQELVGKGLQMRVAPRDKKEPRTEVDWLPGYYNYEGRFVFDGIRLLFSPESVISINAALDGRLLKLQDPEALTVFMQRKLVHLTDVTKNMAFLGSIPGFQMQLVLYLHAANQYLRNENLLFRGLLARSLISHGVHIQERFLPQFGSVKGAYAFYRVPGENVHSIWEYSVGSDFKLEKQQFDARRVAVRQLFENSISDLVTNIDDSVMQHMGGYLNLFPRCIRLRDCVAFNYHAVQVDELLTIDIVGVSLPAMDASAEHGQKRAIKLLYDLVALEIEAATNLFNKVGEDISNYPKPAFGRGGRPFYDPSFKMPESEIIEFEKEHYIPVLSEFRGRMKAIAEKVDAWFSEYTRNQSGLDPLAAANENTRLFLLGSALEKNFNETLSLKSTMQR